MPDQEEPKTYRIPQAVTRYFRHSAIISWTWNRDLKWLVPGCSPPRFDSTRLRTAKFSHSDIVASDRSTEDSDLTSLSQVSGRVGLTLTTSQLMLAVLGLEYWFYKVPLSFCNGLITVSLEFILVSRDCERFWRNTLKVVKVDKVSQYWQWRMYVYGFVFGYL